MIWLTTPMQQRSKSRFICDWLSATVRHPETFPIYPICARSKSSVLSRGVVNVAPYKSTATSTVGEGLAPPETFGTMSSKCEA